MEDIPTAIPYEPSRTKSPLRLVAYCVLIYLLLRIFVAISLTYGITYGLLFLVIFILGVIGYMGMKMRILLKMSLRNVSRRKVNTVIITLGLGSATTG